MNSSHELATLITALRDLRVAARPEAALATIVRTRGSTFRRTGTHMLVFGDGTVTCELSGGCPQRDIMLRAQDAIVTGRPQVARYNADSGLDVLLEMGCSGELDVLIEPLSARSTDFVEALSACMENRRCAHMATLFALDGEVVLPRRMIWCDGAIRFDTIDDARLTASAPRMDPDTIGTARTVRLAAGIGTADVLIERIAPPHALVVIGSSAAARALLPLASALGWEVTLVDHDPLRLRPEQLPIGLRTVCASPAQLRDALPLDAFTSVVVMTHNFEQDVAYLAALRGAPMVYLGALGSRERVGRMRDEAALADMHLHAPAGLDIGSETPGEIALAVAAEIMAVINQRSGGQLFRKDGAIHA